MNYHTVEDGWTILMVTCGQARSAEIHSLVVKLLQQGANPTDHDDDGETCLDWAVHHRNFDAVRALVADVRARSTVGSDDKVGVTRDQCVANAICAAQEDLAKAQADFDNLRKIDQIMAASKGNGKREAKQDESIEDVKEKIELLHQIVEYLRTNDYTGPKPAEKATVDRSDTNK